MKKRYFIFILLLLALLVGCQTRPAETAQAEYVHISLFCDVDFWSGPQWNIDENTVSGKITEQTGVVVDVKRLPQDEDKQLSLMLINDNLPDVISVTDATVISQLASSDKVWKLEEFFQKYLPESHILSDFPKDMKEEFIKRDGAWYAWPSHINSRDARKIWPASAECYEEQGEYDRNRVIIWNRALLKELGLDADQLQTEEQVLAAFEKAKSWNEESNERQIIPLLIDGQDYQEFSLAFLQESFGAVPVDEEGNYMDLMLRPETKDALRFLNTAMKRGYITAEQLTTPNTKIKKYMASRDVLCFIGNMANTAINSMEWISTGPILASSGKVPVSGRRERASTGWLNTFISKSCEHPRELAKWMDFMTSEEGMLLWNFGIEGKDYVWTEDGLLKVTDEGKEASDNGIKSGVNAWWMFANTAWVRSILAPYEEGSYEDWDFQLHVAYEKAPQTKSYDSSLLDFALDEEQTAQEEQLSEYKKAEIIKIIMAGSPAEFEQEYNQMIQGLENLEIHKLDQAKNRQYWKNCQEAGHTITKVNTENE